MYPLISVFCAISFHLSPTSTFHPAVCVLTTGPPSPSSYKVPGCVSGELTSVLISERTLTNLTPHPIAVQGIQYSKAAYKHQCYNISLLWWIVHIMSIFRKTKQCPGWSGKCIQLCGYSLSAVDDSEGIVHWLCSWMQSIVPWYQPFSLGSGWL